MNSDINGMDIRNIWYKLGYHLTQLLMATGLVVLFTSVILLLAGVSPLAAYLNIIKGSLGSWIKFSRVIQAWIPLTLCACGLLFTFRIGLWNIGVEGQIVAGAIMTTLVLRLGMSGTHPGLYLCLAFLAGALGGGIWSFLAGYLKVKAGINEIFAGLGLNFVAQGLVLWLIFGPWKRPGIASMSGTELFVRDLWLPFVPWLRLSPQALILTLAVILTTAVILKKSRMGLMLQSIGSNLVASYLFGMRPKRKMLLAMFVGGAFAGLAGTIQVTGVYHRLIPSISSNYGYLALLVVMLANYNVWWSPLIAVFFACLNVGSIQLPMVLKIDSSLSGVIQGALVLSALALNAWKNRKKV